MGVILEIANYTKKSWLRFVLTLRHTILIITMLLYWLTLFYTGGGSKSPPSHIISVRSLVDATNGSIFHDFVPFNIQQDLANLFLGFLFNFLRNSSLKTYGPPKFCREIWKNRKKSNFSQWNHTFYCWIWILHVLSFLLRYITFL